MEDELTLEDHLSVAFPNKINAIRAQRKGNGGNFVLVARTAIETEELYHAIGEYYARFGMRPRMDGSWLFLDDAQNPDFGDILGHVAITNFSDTSKLEVYITAVAQ